MFSENLIFGWNEDERLSALIPAGKTPAYLITPQEPSLIPEDEKPAESIKSEDELDIFIVILISLIAIGGISYFILKRKSKSEIKYK